MPGRLLAKAQAFNAPPENRVCFMRRSRHRPTAKAHGPWSAWSAWFRKGGGRRFQHAVKISPVSRTVAPVELTPSDASQFFQNKK